MTRPTRALVDLDAIAANFRTLAERAAGAAEILPVVKADAYGHGATPVSKRLAAEGARRFAVALAEEGVLLREAGITQEILLLSSGDPADAALFLRHRLVPALHDVDQARAMAESAEAVAGSGRIPFHLKLDTGMGRLGVRPETLPAMIEVLRRARRLVLSGTFTQLANAAERDAAVTSRQVSVFSEGIAALRSAGLDPGLLHVSNSAGLLVFPDAAFDAVRPGIALYGISPSEEIEDPRLVPALALETRILSVKRVPAGTPLGYGGAFTTSRTTDVAALPIGYHDGLRRSLSGRFSVLLDGGRAPIIGAVSMDLTLVDVTDVGGAAGDTAVVLGRRGGLESSAWDAARAAGTVPYEILCGIGARVPRVYLP